MQKPSLPSSPFLETHSKVRNKMKIKKEEKKFSFKVSLPFSESFAKEKHLQLDMRLKYETGLKVFSL